MNTELIKPKEVTMEKSWLKIGFQELQTQCLEL